MNDFHAPFFRAGADGVEILVRLTPRSSRDAVEGVGETDDGRRRLKARVRAIPEKGKANKALEKLIGKWLDVAPSAVHVTGGSTARLKTVAISGEPAELARRLQALVTI
ncbi:DUF167 family protein [Nitratireductor luteus]|uniref:DUF167 family protein n=1 Tax=Nitratireductor luteus TaxID=2976980 RepID=UPI002240C776|nr:DUF167 family protein [Nitratireductor luteus]